MIAHAGALDQGVLVALRDHDPVVRRYRTFFAHVDWRVIPEQAPPRPQLTGVGLTQCHSNSGRQNVMMGRSTAPRGGIIPFKPHALCG